MYSKTRIAIAGIWVALMPAITAQKTSAQTGTPYFQQEVNNKIDVSLDDRRHILNGNIRIEYINHSPDTLNALYFHLWPNAYAADTTPFARQQVENKSKKFILAPPGDRGFIDSLAWTTGTDTAGSFTPVNTIEAGSADVVLLKLKQPLPPGAKIFIRTPFRVKIPASFSRMGHEGNSYQISQWCPKPAVYDKYGWHPIPYLDQGEFYSEYGTWDVTIDLPSNYVVMATGNLEDPSEQKWLDSLAADKQPVSRFRRTPASDSTRKSLHFHEDRVHDFAWFADKNWIVRKDTLTIPENNQTVTLYTAFGPQYQSEWENGLRYIKNTLLTYSRLVGPYPYKTAKAVQGALVAGGGMEYPTITVIPNADELTVVHETGHNWFYGILGSNERDHAWMDEGINSYFQDFAIRRNSVIEKLDAISGKKGYQQYMATHSDMPVDTPSAVYPENQYGLDIYAKTPDLIRWLRHYIGDTAFEAGIHDYYDTWKFKHVYPEDLQQALQRHTTKNLDWFFDKVLKSGRGIDFALKSVKNKQDKTIITLKNNTGTEGPASISFKGKTPAGDSVTMMRTYEPFTGTYTDTIANPQQIHWYDVRLTGNPADFKQTNDWYRHGAVKFAVRPLAGISKGYYKTWLAPAIGWNNVNGFMAGLLIHNVTMPETRFQYMVAPLYAFGSKTFGGTGVLSYATYPHTRSIHEIDWNLYAKSFGLQKPVNTDIPVTAYFKLAPEIRIQFAREYPRSPVSNTLSIKGYLIGEQQLRYSPNPADSNQYLGFKDGYQKNLYWKLTFQHSNKRTFNPFSYTLEAHGGKDFAKISAEGRLKIDYFYRKKAMNFRFYAGKMFNFTQDAYKVYRYSLTSSYSSWNDYLYDETFLGRNQQSGMWSQQIAQKEGGLVIPTLQYANQIGLSDNWLVAVNYDIDLPIALPVKAFFSLSTFADTYGLDSKKPKNSLFVGGLIYQITRGIQVSFPLFYATQYKTYRNSVYTTKKFLKSVTFTFDLGNIYWPRPQRNIM